MRSVRQGIVVCQSYERFGAAGALEQMSEIPSGSLHGSEVLRSPRP